nr:PocR ligand-binding domain-containing protein [uncultured Desulfobacter sp.]
MNDIKGDIRIVYNSSAKLPNDLPAFLDKKSRRGVIIYRVLRELMGSQRMSKLMSDFYMLTEVPMAVIDLDANVLASSDWEPICTDFHRVNPDTRRRCIDSDIDLANQLEDGAEFTMYHCKNGLVDCTSPIIINDEHIANLFIGQFLLRPPDRSYFLSQSETYGFDRVSYMNALDKVTIIHKAATLLKRELDADERWKCFIANAASQEKRSSRRRWRRLHLRIREVMPGI